MTFQQCFGCTTPLGCGDRVQCGRTTVAHVPPFYFDNGYKTRGPMEPPLDLPPMRPPSDDRWTRERLALTGRIRLGKPHMALHVKTGKFSGLPLWKVAHFTSDPERDTRPWKGHSAAAVEIAPRS